MPLRTSKNVAWQSSLKGGQLPQMFHDFTHV